MKKGLVLIYLLLLSMGIISTGCNENPRLFAGGYSEGSAKGLSVFTFNEKDGNLELLTESDAGPNPSYFCFSGENSLIYFLNEVDEFNGKTGGGLTTLKYDSKTGICEKLNELVVPFGGPCYISRSADKDFLFLANYGSASVVVVKLGKDGIPERATDSILYETDSTNVSHPHMIQQDPAGKFVYVTDLGLDRIMIYDFDKNTGKMNQKSNGICNVPKGSGPRHFTFNADGSKMYLINEPGSTIMAFNIYENGSLELIQTLPSVRKGFDGMNSCADIHIGADGKFLYGSNRGENTIVIFKILEYGTLSLSGHYTCGGDWPRNFIIDPSGKFLLIGNQRSDQISVFRIDKKTGLPEGPVSTAFFKAPACLKFRN